MRALDIERRHCVRSARTRHLRQRTYSLRVPVQRRWGISASLPVQRRRGMRLSLPMYMVSTTEHMVPQSCLFYIFTTWCPTNCADLFWDTMPRPRTPSRALPCADPRSAGDNALPLPPSYPCRSISTILDVARRTRTHGSGASWMNVHARNDSAALAAWHANTARSASAYVATAAARVGASRCAMSPVSCRMRSISCTRASVQCDADKL
jgi:hypothetical protein